MRQTVMIPMRDGIRLATDIYFPDAPRKGLPVLLTRTPYDRRPFRVESSEIWPYIAAGFVVAVQDMRGTFESEGECRVSENERNDGHDTIVWLATQAWSNGKVGTFGGSHRAEAQYQLAATHPRGLTCMVACAGASIMTGATSRSYVHMGGAVNLGISAWYRRSMNTVRPQYPVGTSAADIDQASKFYPLTPVFDEMRFPEDLAHLPVIDILDAVGSPPTEWRELVSHYPGHSFWQRKGHITREDRFGVPILHVNSWFDFGVHETLKLAEMVCTNGLDERTRNNQFVIISPAGHNASEKLQPGSRIGEMDLGDPSFDYTGLYIAWFRRWLCEGGSDFTDLPPVRYYLLNANSWKDSKAWPPSGTEARKLHLSAAQGACGRTSDGRLTPDPQSGRAEDSFQYDPMNPAPTIGGVMWSPGDPPAIPVGPADISAIHERDDVLVYTSAPIDQPTELAGPVSVDLTVRSSAPDTDFAARLSYVTPDGRPLWLTEGILRLRYWAGLDAPRLVPAGEARRIRIDLKATAILLEPGSRLRLDITSSNFPRFERNLNSGGNNFDESEAMIAMNTVVYDPENPCCVNIHISAPLAAAG